MKQHKMVAKWFVYTCADLYVVATCAMIVCLSRCLADTSTSPIKLRLALVYPGFMLSGGLKQDIRPVLSAIITHLENLFVLALCGIQIQLQEAHILQELLGNPGNVLICLQLQRNTLCEKGFRLSLYLFSLPSPDLHLCVCMYERVVECLRAEARAFVYQFRASLWSNYT